MKIWITTVDDVKSITLSCDAGTSKGLAIDDADTMAEAEPANADVAVIKWTRALIRFCML